MSTTLLFSLPSGSVTLTADGLLLPLLQELRRELGSAPSGRAAPPTAGAPLPLQAELPGLDEIERANGRSPFYRSAQATRGIADLVERLGTVPAEITEITVGQVLDLMGWDPALHDRILGRRLATSSWIPGAKRAGALLAIPGHKGRYTITAKRRT